MSKDNVYEIYLRSSEKVPLTSTIKVTANSDDEAINKFKESLFEDHQFVVRKIK